MLSLLASSYLILLLFQSEMFIYECDSPQCSVFLLMLVFRNVDGFFFIFFQLISNRNQRLVLIFIRESILQVVGKEQ